MSARFWRVLVALVLPMSACLGQDVSVTVNPTCSCYDDAYLYLLFAEDETYALTWDQRWRDDLVDVLSLRSYTWSYDEVSGMWESPTMGADAYRDPSEGDQAYCEVWSGTWLAAPVHDWADDIRSARVKVSDADFAACDQSLRTWIENEGVPVYAW